MKTIDELLKEVSDEKKQDQLQRVETDPEEDEFFKLSVEERLELLPF